MKFGCLCFVILILAGCASKSIYVEPTNHADRILYYYELDRRNKPHPISSEAVDAEAFKTTRVPNPSLVDIDSSIQIKVRRPPEETLVTLYSENTNRLLQKKKTMEDLIEQLSEVMTAREKALKAYARGIRGPDLDQLINVLANKKLSFIKQFKSIYPRGSEPYRAANRAVGKGGGLGALKTFLEEDINGISAGDNDIQEKAKSHSSTLRLEAFLDKHGEELVAIHVKGYDSLPEMRVAARDRWGLNLSECERRELQGQIEATEALALTIDKVRTTELSIKEGIGNVLHITAPDLAEQVKKAEVLVGKLTDQQRLEGVKKDFDRAIEKARQDLDRFSSEQLDAAAQLVDSLPRILVKDVAGVDTLLVMIADGDKLVGQWRQADSIRDYESIATLVVDTGELARQLMNEKSKLPKWVQEAATSTKTLLNQHVESVQQDVIATLEELTNAEELQVVLEDVQSYYADVRSAVEVIDRVTRLLKIGQIPVEQVAPEVPEAFEVGIEDLQDTAIDLKRLPLKDGDSVLLRATYKKPGHKAVVSEPKFEITHYGWYAKLSPSVVLVKPTELESGNESYRFAPALGWMHHYRPRPSDKGVASFLRPMEMSFGLHSIFLNFDDESGIGLGATLSFWNDRLQFGAGYNLSADADDNGRYYYYVGSDLIGLLQTVGIGRE
jgi:hypothetical protein